MSRVGKAPGITNSVKEPVPPSGEDTVSYERHTKALQAEFRKTNRNNAVVSDLMGRSFALRRAEILEKTTVFRHFYPDFLSCKRLIR